MTATTTQRQPTRQPGFPEPHPTPLQALTPPPTQALPCFAIPSLQSTHLFNTHKLPILLDPIFYHLPRTMGSCLSKPQDATDGPASAVSRAIDKALKEVSRRPGVPCRGEKPAATDRGQRFLSRTCGSTTALRASLDPGCPTMQSMAHLYPLHPPIRGSGGDGVHCGRDSCSWELQT